MSKTSLDKSKIKFLLLEGVHQSAVDVLKSAGYTSIEYITSSLPEAQLKEKIADAHFIGIRSRTQLTEEIFDHAKKLVAVGCFYPAIDSTAGERERSTWETLMTVSASRGSIIAAKYLYVASFAAFSAAMPRMVPGPMVRSMSPSSRSATSQ